MKVSVKLPTIHMELMVALIIAMLTVVSELFVCNQSFFWLMRRIQAVSVISQLALSDTLLRQAIIERHIGLIAIRNTIETSIIITDEQSTHYTAMVECHFNKMEASQCLLQPFM